MQDIANLDSAWVFDDRGTLREVKREMDRGQAR